MVNTEILEGLRSSINRGETLFKSMMTFYNAGYSKEEIEEAATIIQKEMGAKDSEQIKSMPETNPVISEPQKTETKQLVSKYEQIPIKTIPKWAIIVLASLGILVAVLAAIYLLTD